MGKMKNSAFNPATLAGIFAILAWSTNIAFCKSVMNELGDYQAMFLMNFFSGFIMLLLLLARFRSEYFTRLKALSIRYYAGTGIFLFLNNTLLFLAVGLATNEKELLIVTICNYLWPILIYVIKIPVFRLKVRAIPFIISIILGIIGVVLAFSQEYTLRELLDLARSLDDNFLAYLLALLTAVSWALYSNLTRKFVTDDDFAAVPLIFMLSGLPFLYLMVSRGEFEWRVLTSLYTNIELIYTILLPISLGYILWNVAIKKGNKDLVVSLSFLIPLFSIFFISLKFAVRPGMLTWIASLFLITSAYLSYRTVNSGQDH
jgi:drug/metabolite transporter (DMT)-like permease